ncbi:hypothetical protein CA54_21740 [Symmachiella macrocystis]|uniref:Uncharacterized protein n=1 Tax=Symmachiella macrocystis TaxID=2527985 RepID=A0A5C6BQZ4_9PLAN|nr:hypothetical protein [Symmachiella macrocystis]TWU13339.1 hypothetical protein CA54_21740 [Symmachiella macrocystis]
MATALERTDVHRPSVIDPADYQFIAVEYDRTDDPGEVAMLAEQRRILWEFMQRTGAMYSRHRHGGNCHVCGAHCLYTAAFWHQPTNTLIRTGFDCAEKLDMGDPDIFRTFRKTIGDALQRKAGKAKAQALLTELGLSAAWEIYTGPDWTWHDCGKWSAKHQAQLAIDSRIGRIKRLVANVIRFGDIPEFAEKQLRELLEIGFDYEAELQFRRQQLADRLPAPAGKVEIVGTLQSIKAVFSQYGETIKGTIETAAGWKTFGTIPRAILDDLHAAGLIAHGDFGEIWLRKSATVGVRFTATVTPSDRDEYFSFFKRPTKPACEITEAE